MSTFVPDPGTLFYADPTLYYTRQVGSGDTAVAVREQDRSHAEKVMRCIAVDARVVIAEVAWSQCFWDKADKDRRRTMLLRSEYRFQPLGPGVAEALGIEF